MQGSTRIDELRQKFHENPRRYFAPLANEYRKAGDPEQAIAICRAHLAQQPGHMSGHVVYGQALYDAKRAEEARVVFEKALQLDPDNAIVLRHLGDIAREKGDTAEAKHWYSRALDVDPSDREAAAYVAELTEPVTEETASVTEDATPEVSEPSREPEVIEAIEEPMTSEEPVTREEPVIVGEPVMAEEPAPAVQDEASWRKTPPHEESPFVTRTMAELYSNQGYHQAALDVYRQLALQHPDDKEISDRIEALEKKNLRPATPSAPQEAIDVSTPRETVDGSASITEETPASAIAETPGEPDALETIPFEPFITDLPVESQPGAYAELDTESAFAPSDEDLNLDVAAEAPDSSQPHFTEMELSAGGDAWDSDSWGAGFSGEEDANLDFVTPDSPTPEPASVDEPASVEESVSEARLAETSASVEVGEEVAAPEESVPPVFESESPADEVADRAQQQELEREPESDAQPEPEPVPESEPEAESEPEPEPVPVPLPIAEPVTPSEPEPVAELAAAEEGARDIVAPPPSEQPVSETPPPEIAEEDDDAFVAYSPQLPEDEDLPHYVPKGPTVREFFATLGSFQPSARAGSSITAHAAFTDASPASDYPLASDAFSTLFPDSAVSDEDTRAAFALSGALGASEPPSSAAIAPTEPQPAPEVASPAATQESEEDIRRFREWLDGLAET